MNIKIVSLVIVFIVTVLAIKIIFVPTPECFWPQTTINVSGDSTYSQEEISTQEATLTETTEKYYIVSGNSMFPTMQNGQVCRCIQSGIYDIGDIITYKVLVSSSDNIYQLISHRIVEGNEDVFHTKGDGNEYADGWLVPPNNVLCEIAQTSVWERWFG